MVKTCCVTGHREIEPGMVAHVKEALRQEVEEAVKDGYSHFISGFAEGVDLWFAEIVLSIKKEFSHLTLEAAIPYRNRVKRLMEAEQTKGLITQCNAIGVHSEEYTPDCFMQRNRFMLNLSSRVIAVYDGRDGGGTLNTMKEARIKGRDLRVIKI